MCTTQCAQCLSHIMSNFLRSKPCMLMRVCVHQVLDTCMLAIMNLATSINNMKKHKPRPKTFPLHAMYRALNKSLVPRRIPLPSPLNNCLKYYLHQISIYFQIIYIGAVTTRLIPWCIPLPSPFHFTATIKVFAHLNACPFSFPLHTWVSLLIPPNHGLYSAIPSSSCCPYDLLSAATFSCSRLAALWRRHILMLCSMLVHTTNASPNLQFSWSLHHCLSTIQEHLLNYDLLASLLHPSPTLAMHEQVCHILPLMSQGFIIWLSLLPSSAANCLSTIGLQPQPPLLPH